MDLYYGNLVSVFFLVSSIINWFHLLKETHTSSNDVDLLRFARYKYYLTISFWSTRTKRRTIVKKSLQWVSCCDVHYDFLINTMFGSSLPPIVCGWIHVLIALFVYSGVPHILCYLFLRLVCPVLPVSLDCPFLIALQYSLTFIFIITYGIGNQSTLRKPST